jgi:HlyD family secretion protein
MKKKRILLFVAAIVIAGVLTYFLSESYYGHGSLDIVASGHVEVTEVDLSFRMPGHVARMRVDEGDYVTKGQLLAELDQVPLLVRRDQAAAQLDEFQARLASLQLAIEMKESLLAAQLKQAEAGLSAADARYKSLKRGSRAEEIAEAKAMRDKAKTEFENRRIDFERMKALYEQKIVSASQYDAARASQEAALAAFNAAKERYKLVKAGPRQESVQEGEADLAGYDAAVAAAEANSQEVDKMRLDHQALQAQRDQAKAALNLAEDDLAKSRLYAPFEGTVIVKDVEEMEFVQAGAPVLTVAQLNWVWVRTYIPETQLGRVYFGQEASVTSDTFPLRILPGVVSFISPEAEFTPKNVQTKEERVKLVYQIKVKVENPHQQLKAGMPVEVTLR